MSLQELRREMSEMTFFGHEEEGKVLGVAGYQPVKDVTLVRHIYVLPEHQRRGIGSKLLSYLMGMATSRQILVGTWEAATWAIRFYEKHGFKLLPNKNELLRRYWKIQERQIEPSIVLGKERQPSTRTRVCGTALGGCDNPARNESGPKNCHTSVRSFSSFLPLNRNQQRDNRLP
jgi:N-acetylglutamate synthase-like GNAT family acetyltransferase